MTERELAALFEQSLPMHYRMRKPYPISLVVPEVGGPFRRPDFVQIDWKDPTDATDDTLAKLQAFHSLVAARSYLVVRNLHECHWTAVWEAVGYEPDTIKRHLSILTDYSWLERISPGHYCINPAQSLPEFCLSTFELKLNNWRRAIYQLSAHKMCADRATLVMPPPVRPDTEARIIESISSRNMSLIFATESDMRVVVWQRSYRRSANWRLCALGSAASAIVNGV